MLLLEDKISRVIDTLDIPDNFGVDTENDYSYDVETMSFYINNTFGGSVYHGVSKAAVVLPDCKYAIKIPFNGEFRYEEDYNEETEEYEIVEDSFCPFEYANDLGIEDACNWDYCENELIKYENAVDAGFEEFFAETKFWGYKNNRPIYLQEKVVAYNEDRTTHTPSDRARNSYDNNCDFHFDANETWVCCAIDWYGEDRVLDFITYCEDNDLADDLHDGNIGFAADGRPILLDWAGWRG